MKKSIKVVSASFIICHLSFSPASAQNRAALYDSTQVEALQEVVVKGVRAQKNAPYAISNIKKNINTAELLEKFRTQSDELAFRESEIQKSLAGIKESRAEIGKLQYETESILDALSETCIVTRYDINAVVQDLRDKTLDVTGYKRSDIVGHSLREILALTKNDMENFDKFWDEIIKGKKKSRKFTRGEQLYRETFTLINNAEGQPYKVISVAIPV